MRLAIIGAGISGLVAAYQLRDSAEIHLFEANSYLGGHTHTVDVRLGDKPFAIDTGFIVFNARTYPNFCKLLDRLGVDSQPTDMSFGVVDERLDLEYAAPTPLGLFAQPGRLADADHWRMLRDIPRFNRVALAAISNGHAAATIGELLDSHRLASRFTNQYLTPMLSAVWSADRNDVRDMPAGQFLRFMKNHGLLSLTNRPRWCVIKGGSRNYIAPLLAASRAKVHLNTPVRRVTRHPNHVLLEVPGGEPQRFDHVILAVHSDQALGMLADASDRERDILGAISYQTNVVDLHTYRGILPKSRRAWASWNFRIRPGHSSRACVTYHMNRLQSLQAPAEFCVTLNQREHIPREALLGQFEYAHPVYRAAATRAQVRFGEISGMNRTHFCGAYWGNGFHEDGVNSALAACRYFATGEIA